MRISDWSSDVCSSDLEDLLPGIELPGRRMRAFREHAAALGEPDYVVAVQNVLPDPEHGDHDDADHEAEGEEVVGVFSADGQRGEDLRSDERSEEGRVGKASGSTCSSRWSPEQKT